ncbi:MAG: TIM barrel protein [Planctomycetota bacterium]|jgi:hydroxypyruvate isomerase|nr:TIM barrel protein [Planctomycetota bacterium]
MKLKKSACIETLFTELPWEKRFQAAREAGFDYVEFWNWREKDVGRIRRLAEEAGIPISNFNGDEQFSLIDPDQAGEYLAFMEQSLAVAVELGAQALTIHSNALGEGGVVVRRYEELSDAVKLCAMFAALKACAALAEKSGVTLNIEPLNTIADHAGNYLAGARTAAELCRRVASPRLKMVYDVYHMQLSEGNLLNNISTYFEEIGHVHVADVPGRHEPGTGEINYPAVFRHLEGLGYSRVVGFELFPKFDTASAVKAIMSC